MVRVALSGRSWSVDGHRSPTSRAGLLRIGTLTLVAVMAALLAWRLLPRLALFAETGPSFIRWSWTIDRDEAVNLNSAYLLSRGHDIYAVDPDGFTATPYPPLLSIVG